VTARAQRRHPGGLTGKSVQYLLSW
jgi:hypothetical protein